MYSCSGCSEQKATNQKIEKSAQNLSLQDSLSVFFTYGELAPIGYLDDANVITEKYGFQLKSIAGCVIDDGIIYKAHTQNQKALLEMNEKYGKDWMIEFEKTTHYKLSIPFD